MSKGFSLLSLLAIESDAVLAPALVGVKRTVNVVCPALATGEDGCATMVKSAASMPPRITLGVPFSVRLAEPVFLRVKTKSFELPTMTASNALLPPSGMSTAECSIAISGRPRVVKVMSGP